MLEEVIELNYTCEYKMRAQSELTFILTRRLSKLGTFRTHSIGSVGKAQQSLSEKMFLSTAQTITGRTGNPAEYSKIITSAPHTQKVVVAFFGKPLKIWG